MSMNLGLNPEHAPLLQRVRDMIRDEVMPLEEEYHNEIAKEDRWSYTARQAEILEGLKAKAKAAGLWNFWLTDSERGFGLSTVDYAYFAEEMGRTPLGAEGPRGAALYGALAAGPRRADARPRARLGARRGPPPPLRGRRRGAAAVLERGLL